MTIGKLSVILGINSRRFTEGMRGAAKDTLTTDKSIGRMANTIETRLVGAYANLQKRMQGGSLRMNQALRDNIGRIKQFSGTLERAALFARDNWMMIGGAVAAVGAAITVAANAVARFAIEQKNAILGAERFADRMGLAVDEYRALANLAQRRGVPVQQFQMALQRFERRIALAARGEGEAFDPLVEMGLDPAKLAAMRPEDAFLAVGDALSQVEDSYLATLYAQKIFDSEGVKTIQMFKGGYKEMAKELEKIRRLQGETTQEMIDGANKLDDSIADANTVWDNLQRAFFGAGVGDELSKWVDYVTAWVHALGLVVDKVLEIYRWFSKLGALEIVRWMKEKFTDLVLPKDVEEAIEGGPADAKLSGEREQQLLGETEKAQERAADRAEKHQEFLAGMRRTEEIRREQAAKRNEKWFDMMEKGAKAGAEALAETMDPFARKTPAEVATWKATKEMESLQDKLEDLRDAEKERGKVKPAEMRQTAFQGSQAFAKAMMGVQHTDPALREQKKTTKEITKVEKQLKKLRREQTEREREERDIEFIQYQGP